MKMKIERVEIAANKMMLRKPFKIALGVITEVSNLTIKVITDTGGYLHYFSNQNPLLPSMAVLFSSFCPV